MIGRWTDAGQLGTYALGNSLLVMLIWAQDALITRPYCIQLDRTFGTPAEHAFHALLLSVVLAFGATFALGAIAVVAFACGAQPELPGFVFAVAAAVPFVLLREFARRFAFAHMKMLQALMLDVAVAILFVAVLASLGSTGQLSARSGFAALAISCGLSATAWL